MNILFICTSNKDRSPALEVHFRINHPEHQYRSAGINGYYTQKNGTRHVSSQDIDWADIVVYAEDIHFRYCFDRFAHVVLKWNKMTHKVLNLGGTVNYIDEQHAYLIAAGIRLKELFQSINSQ